VPRALLSVTDKTNLVPFASGLAAAGWDLVSTGGTSRTLREAGLPVKDVSEVTGFPEMMDGRVKTLHPLIHGGILGDTHNPSHVEQMASAGMEPIGLVVVNLYAFEETVTQPHTPEEAIESIDIGGPAMIRAAAKNHASCSIVVDPGDYDQVLAWIQQGGVSLEGRRTLAAKAFRHTALYDSLISRYLTLETGGWGQESVTIGYRRSQSLRYGENPHQSAGLYIDPLTPGGVARARQVHGKDLSYNNLLDGDAAWELCCDLPWGSVAIIKHGNPCGAAAAGSLAESYTLARQADPISAFGGIAACHGPIDKEAAEAMTAKGNFLEVVIGTTFSPEAIEVFAAKPGWGINVRLLEAETSRAESFLTARTIRGGALLQMSDEDPAWDWNVATVKQPTPEEEEALRLAWKMIPHVKSNAILVADHRRLLGTGAGQMNRVQSVRLALEQAGSLAKGAVLASDAFFPFPDSIETAAAAGISAVIQPGGSKKDSEVIAAADRLGVSIVLTGVRHFRH
jgi:phosphoribosylaminoimidazolecarboxamide formyltransferase/IMP cyclohydrolase